ncbi:MAG: hypothetical protein JWQ50_4815 [Caballeronia mineralivorans]|jgi:hypothetical protein|nr:hypothetical protein [Caballeronia mineralivorans]MEA3096759.1 hypothetical protein [Caballeronia mineralivorans]
MENYCCRKVGDGVPQIQSFSRLSSHQGTPDLFQGRDTVTAKNGRYAAALAEAVDRNDAYMLATGKAIFTSCSAKRATWARTSWCARALTVWRVTASIRSPKKCRRRRSKGCMIAGPFNQIILGQDKFPGTYHRASSSGRHFVSLSLPAHALASHGSRTHIVLSSSSISLRECASNVSSDGTPKGAFNITLTSIAPTFPGHGLDRLISESKAYLERMVSAAQCVE